MKLLRRFSFFLAFIAGTFSLSAQDFHKSLYNMMPLSVNPAYAGDFEGTFRISGMYKNQLDTWTTPSFSVDAPIIMVRKRDWLSAGISFDTDKGGELDYGWNRSLVGVSYHLSLDKKGNDYFVLGYQFGSDGIKTNTANARTIDQNDPTLTSNSGGSGSGNGREDLSDAKISNIGLMYRSQLDKNTMLNIGASYLYLFRQGNKVSTGSTANNEKRPSGLVVHGLIDRNIDKKLSIHPSFIISNRGQEGTDVKIQTMVGYLLRPDLALRLKGGVGFDLGQGPALLLGADYGEWRFGISYEFPVYGIAETATGFGGLEISASKIINVYKKPAVEPTICCPDL